MTRRLKFYGWGAEGEGLSEPERDHLFRFVANRLGAEPRPLRRRRRNPRSPSPPRASRRRPRSRAF